MPLSAVLAVCKTTWGINFCRNSCPPWQKKTGAAIDNLDKAERLGWIESAETWLEIRKLSNQMVHEYIEDLTILTSALQTGHQHVSTLVSVGQKMMAEATRLMR